ncbi:MAG: alpha/beta hydrolase [Rhodopirellula sp. JB044]|uniref:alpha/beta hydrolase n=1 Tax=Rhodopirellula sp. JB044 TaxID=3342844 RepID=UPI003709E0EC
MSGSFSRRWTSRPLSEESTPEQCSGDDPDGDSCGDESKPPTQNSFLPRLSHTNRRNSVQMLTPLHYQHGYQYPLIVWLHSAGGNERQIENVLPHISTRNYVGLGVRATRAIDVRGRGFDWPCGRDATAKASEIVLDAIDQTMEEFSIHPDRVVLAGYGSGATLACKIALLQSDRIAGVVRMGGQFPDASGVFKNFKQLRERRIPMLWQQAINGYDDDPDMLQRDITAAQCIRAQVEIRQYRGDDVMNTVALKDIDRWCFDKIIAPKPTEPCVGEATLDGSEFTTVDFSAN